MQNLQDVVIGEDISAAKQAFLYDLLAMIHELSETPLNIHHLYRVEGAEDDDAAYNADAVYEAVLEATP